jgi:hypothetical protein
LRGQIAWQLLHEYDVADELCFTVWTAAAEAGVYLRLHYAKGAHYVEAIVNPIGDQVWVLWATERQNMLAILLGPVLIGVLRQRGRTCLHASVVALGEQSIALLGSAGTGKSTTAAALAQTGVTVVADDVAVLCEAEQRFGVEPGVSRLRLTPQAADALVGRSAKLPRVFSRTKFAPAKRYLDLPPAHQPVSQAAYPLRAIYLLQERDAALSMPFITPVAGMMALPTLLHHTSAAFLLNQEQRVAEFQRLARLTAQVPVRQIHRPNDLATLPQLCALIRSDIELVSGPRSRPHAVVAR